MGIKVTVTEQEQKSGDRGGAYPVGRYHTVISDVTLTSPATGDNVGKNMLLFEFTVIESDQHQVQGHDVNAEFASNNRKMFANACIWEEALYTIVGIAKATGDYDKIYANGTLDVPDDPDFWCTKEVICRIALDPKAKAKNPDNPDYWYPIRGFAAPRGAKVSNGSPTGSSSGTPVAAEEGALLP